MQAKIRDEAMGLLADASSEFQEDGGPNEDQLDFLLTAQRSILKHKTAQRAMILQKRRGNTTNITTTLNNRQNVMDRNQTQSYEGLLPPVVPVHQEKQDYSKITQSCANCLVQPGDFIYQQLPGESAPIVLEHYKLIFFAQAKVGCTVWKLLFRRMMGYRDWQSTTNGLPHVPQRNGLKYLYHYNQSYASHMMTSPDWVRAIIVRDPKERFLSAYLDKAVEESLFIDTCCNRHRQIYCNPTPPPIHEFFGAIKTCHDSHWDPQSNRMEAKYWPYINFVGHLETIEHDSERLLRRIKAWKHFGMSGWGPQQKDAIFVSNDGTQHANNAKSKVDEYIFPELEKELEDLYRDDYDNKWFNLTRSKQYANPDDVKHDSLAKVPRPLVQPQDWIYRKARYSGEASPIVLEEYKLLFFTIPHVADVEFKRLFLRIIGEEDWKTRTYNQRDPEKFNKGLRFLRDYSLKEASEMMKSHEWTRAMFVRDPKERFALAYAHMAIRNRVLLHQICCTLMPKWFCFHGKGTKDLVASTPNATYFLEGIHTCKSTHWDPMVERLSALRRWGINPQQKEGMDPHYFSQNKYWKYINFYGRMDDAKVYAKKLLMHIGAWDKYGASGWADQPSEVSSGNDSFLNTVKFLREELKVQKSVQQYINNPDMEATLEEFYQRDYKRFRLPVKKLFSSKGETYGKIANNLRSNVESLQGKTVEAGQRIW